MSRTRNSEGGWTGFRARLETAVLLRRGREYDETDQIEPAPLLRRLWLSDQVKIVEPPVLAEQPVDETCVIDTSPCDMESLPVAEATIMTDAMYKTLYVPCAL